MKKWFGGVVVLLLCLSGCAATSAVHDKWSCSSKAFFTGGQMVMSLDSLAMGRVVGCQRGRLGDVYRAKTEKGQRFKVLAQRAAAVHASVAQVEKVGE